jgi:hypothetical protein
MELKEGDNIRSNGMGGTIYEIIDAKDKHNIVAVPLKFRGKWLICIDPKCYHNDLDKFKKIKTKEGK